jgi:hypothetical protein
MKKSADTRGVPHPGDKIHIPLPFKEAVRGLLKVKPTQDMPRPGAQPTKPKKQRAKRGRPSKNQ